MNAVHFLCHADPLGPCNSKPNGKPGLLMLGWWKMSAEEAESLVGGWAYLHESSGVPAYSTYRIRGFKPGSDEWSGKWGFDLEKEPTIKAVAWRGLKAGQNPIDNYRICAVSLRHELASA